MDAAPRHPYTQHHRAGKVASRPPTCWVPTFTFTFTFRTCVRAWSPGKVPGPKCANDAGSPAALTLVLLQRKAALLTGFAAWQRGLSAPLQCLPPCARHLQLPHISN